MAIAAIHPRAHSERGFAHYRERRSPQVGVSSLPPLPATPIMEGTAATSAPASASSSATGLPTDVKALAGVITVLGLFIFGFSIWRIRAWRRRRTNTLSNLINTSNEKQGFKTHVDLEAAMYVEKPSKAVLKPVIPPASAGVAWVPQLRSDIALPEPTKERSMRAKKAWEKNLAKFMTPAVPDHEPPPSYVPRIPPPLPATPMSPPRHALPPTPPASMKLSFDGITPPSLNTKSTFGPARTSSIATNLTPVPRLSSSSRRSEKKIPRLMSVGHAFDPSMEDELYVSVGETVRLVEEYEDAWCLVQRAGRIDAERGVIPRFCLVERTEVVPARPGLPASGSYRR